MSKSTLLNAISAFIIRIRAGCYTRNRSNFTLFSVIDCEVVVESDYMKIHDAKLLQSLILYDSNEFPLSLT